MKDVKWEFICNSDDSITTRLRVPGGWLYKVSFYRQNTHSENTITFVPDLTVDVGEE